MSCSKQSAWELSVVCRTLRDLREFWPVTLLVFVGSEAVFAFSALWADTLVGADAWQRESVRVVVGLVAGLAVLALGVLLYAWWIAPYRQLRITRRAYEALLAASARQPDIELELEDARVYEADTQLLVKFPRIRILNRSDQDSVSLTFELRVSPGGKLAPNHVVARHYEIDKSLHPAIGDALTTRTIDVPRQGSSPDGALVFGVMKGFITGRDAYLHRMKDHVRGVTFFLAYDHAVLYATEHHTGTVRTFPTSPGTYQWAADADNLLPTGVEPG